MSTDNAAQETVVTFHASGRTFERVFREQSLDDTKKIVIEKLGLHSHAEVRLARLQNGRRIDLEDDDDFEAFRKSFTLNSRPEIVVTVGGSRPEIASLAQTNLPQDVLKRRRSRALMHDEDERRKDPSGIPSYSAAVNPHGTRAPRGSSGSFDVAPETERPAKKRRKKKSLFSPLSDVPPITSSQLLEQASPARPDQSKSSPNGQTTSASSLMKSSQNPLATSRASEPRAESNQPVTTLCKPTDPPKTKKRKRRSIATPMTTASRPATTETTSSVESRQSVPASVVPFHSPTQPSVVRKAFKNRKDKPKLPPDSLSELCPSAIEPVPEPHSTSPVRKRPRKAKETEAAAQSSTKDNADQTSEMVLTELGSSPQEKVKKTTDRPTSLPISVSDVETSVVPMDTHKPGMDQVPTSVVVGSDSLLEDKKDKEDKKGKKKKAAAAAQSADSLVPEGEPSDKLPLATGVDKPKKEKKSIKETRVKEPASNGPSGAPATISSAQDASQLVGKVKKRKGTNKTSPAEQPVQETAQEQSVSKSSESNKRTKKATKSTSESLPGPSEETGPPVEEAAKDEAVNLSKTTSRKESRLKAFTEAREASGSGDASSAPEQGATQSLMTATSTGEPAKAKAKKSQGKGKKVVEKPKAKRAVSDEELKVVLEAAKAAVLAKCTATSTQKEAPSGPVAEPTTSQRAQITPTADATLDQAPATVSPQKKTALHSVAEPPSRATAESASAPESCPVCEGIPLHLRADCPTVIAGAHAIKERLNEIKKSHLDPQLVEELETLLPTQPTKSIDQLDKSSSVAQAKDLAATATTAASDAVGRVEPLEGAKHLRLPSLAYSSSRSISPRIPAGSEIAEVLVEGQDEGSSNESSGSDDEDSNTKNRPPAEVDLSALLRGPARRGSVLVQIPSESSDEEDDKRESDDEEDEEMLDRKFRRLSRKYERAGSSDEDIVNGMVSDNDDVAPPNFMDIDPKDAVTDQADSADQSALVVEARKGGFHDGTPDSAEREVNAEDKANNSSRATDNESDDIPTSEPLADPEAPVGSEHGDADNQPDSQPGGCHESQNVPATDDEGAPSPTLVPQSVDETIPVADQDAHEPHVTDIDVDTPVSNVRSTASIPCEPNPDNIESDPINPPSDPRAPPVDDDPIEVEVSPSPKRRLRSRPPNSRQSTINQMKDRFGRLPGEGPDPEDVASSVLEGATHSTPAKLALRFKADEGNATPTRGTRKYMRRITEMPPPPDPRITTPQAPVAPKSRGRPRLTEEEKARRDAEKARIKAQREEERRRKKEEKEAEKAVKAQQKKGGKAKAKKVPPVSTGAPPATPDVMAEKASETNASQEQPVMWTVLPVSLTPGYVDADSSIIDQLRSSSPAQSMPKMGSQTDGPAQDEDEAGQNDVSDLINGKHREESQDEPSPSDPLFLPGSSQFQATPFVRKSHSVSMRRSSSPIASEEVGLPGRPAHPARRQTWFGAAPFRGLAELASQNLFTSPGSFSVTPVPAKNFASLAKDEESDDDDEEDNSSSDGSESDSNPKPSSYIPLERRASATVQKKKKGGLLGFTK